MKFSNWYLGLAEVYELREFSPEGSRTPLSVYTASGTGAAPPHKRGNETDHSSTQGDQRLRSRGSFTTKLLKILPAETSAVYAFASGTLDTNSGNTANIVFIFISCIVVTAVLRFPPVLLAKGRRQIAFYLLHLAVCVLWLYSVGLYIFDFHKNDDSYAAILMMILGIFFSYFYEPNKFSNPMSATNGE